MIKFFRKIRKNLLSQNKFSQYLLYAIGEIILVVIGILIALQINNWNESRQKKNLERDYLSEIKENLVRDTLNINKTLDFSSKKIDSIVNSLALFEQAKKGLPYFKSFSPKMAILTDHVIFEPVRTGFDNMVSSEKIGLISNKKLRAELSNYYSDFSFRDGTQKRILQITRDFTDDIVSKAMSKELMQSFIGLELDLKSASEINIHSDEKVISTLLIMLQVTGSLNNELTEKKATIKDILAKIETELKLR